MGISKVALFMPTYNAGPDFNKVLDLIDEQSEYINKKYIIDSSSSDDTVNIARNHNFDVKVIKSEEFGHGKTRTQAAKDLKDFDYIIYMTQDIYLQKNALKLLINFIESNSDIAVAYGKQEIDIEKGNVFEYRSRSFNYPDESIVKAKADISSLGIKTVFTSDAFCIYNIIKLKEVNYFPEDINFSEDMYVAAKFINANYKVGYCANSKVFHTHNFSIIEEFKRYKDIGRFHKTYPEIQNQFGKNTNEGVKLVINEMKYLINNKQIIKIPESLLRNLAKYIGYRTA